MLSSPRPDILLLHYSRCPDCVIGQVHISWALLTRRCVLRCLLSHAGATASCKHAVQACADCMALHLASNHCSSSGVKGSTCTIKCAFRNVHRVQGMQQSDVGAFSLTLMMQLYLPGSYTHEGMSGNMKIFTAKIMTLHLSFLGSLCLIHFNAFPKKTRRISCNGKRSVYTGSCSLQ